MILLFSISHSQSAEDEPPPCSAGIEFEGRGIEFSSESSELDFVPAQETHSPAIITTVRTGAFVKGESDLSAFGQELKYHSEYHSVAADWSRFPLGTKFKIKGYDRVFVVDDHRIELVGTRSIDLYFPDQARAEDWGVRWVEIEILEFGSFSLSRQTLENGPATEDRLAVIGALEEIASPHAETKEFLTHSDVNDQEANSPKKKAAAIEYPYLRKNAGIGTNTLPPKSIQENSFYVPALRKSMSEGEALEELNRARSRNSTAEYDYLNSDDYRFQVARLIDKEERKWRGRDTGWAADKLHRFFQSFLANLMRMAGMSELAQTFEISTFPENPADDGSGWSKVVQKLGDFLAIAVFFTLAVLLSKFLLTKNFVSGLSQRRLLHLSIGSGAIAALVGNIVKEYGIAVRTTFAETGNEYHASQAGMEAVPRAIFVSIFISLVLGYALVRLRFAESWFKPSRIPENVDPVSIHSQS